MTSTPLNRLVQTLRQTLEADDRSNQTDADLLAAYRESRDAVAFEAIVRRHGPRVLGTCRKVLGESADVEDAFQATFLVLMRDARAVRLAASLGGWLTGVAHRVALKARAMRRRRAEIEARADARPSPAPPDLSWREACAILHEELDRLPESYRLPLMLCYLEGLSRDEAAASLGVSLNAVKKRLEMGRTRLRTRLEKRGVSLSAGLLTAATVGPLATALSPALVRFAVEGLLGDPVPPAASALARAAFGSAASTLKASAGAMLAASIIAVTIAIGMSPVTAEESKNPKSMLAKEMPAKPKENKNAPHLIPALDTDQKIPAQFTYKGKVLGPDGTPVKGAKIFYYVPSTRRIPLRAESAADGTFSLVVKRTEFDEGSYVHSPTPWQNGWLLATAPGYGVAWGKYVSLPVETNDRENELRLSKDDAPIRGRVVNLEGKPVAGVRARVIGLWRPIGLSSGFVQAVLNPHADLANFQTALKRMRRSRDVMNEHLTGFDEYDLRLGALDVLVPPVKSGPDGTFDLPGVGSERVALVRLEGDEIETADLYVITRRGEALTVTQYKDEDPRFALPKHTFVATPFRHAAAPSRPIVGIVRATDTGKPVAGALVCVEHIQDSNVIDNLRALTRTDAAGRFKLTGLPLKSENRVRVEPPRGEPFLIEAAKVPLPAGLGPIPLDITLTRGIWIEGHVLDENTRKPVPADLTYYVPLTNPHVKTASNFRSVNRSSVRRNDGGFRFVGLPGEGIIGLNFRGENQYAGVAGVAAMPARIAAKPFDFSADYTATYARIDPAEGATRYEKDILLTLGKSVGGTVVGLDGKRVKRAIVSGLTPLDYWRSTTSADGTFRAVGFGPGKPRFIQAISADHRLAGAIRVMGEESEPVVLKLEISGVITGRLVDDAGEARPNVRLSFTWENTPEANEKQRMGMHPSGQFETDKAGRFRIDGLVPGMNYTLIHVKGSVVQGFVFTRQAIKSGENKDLGDVRVK